MQFPKTSQVLALSCIRSVIVHMFHLILDQFISFQITAYYTSPFLLTVPYLSEYANSLTNSVKLELSKISRTIWMTKFERQHLSYKIWMNIEW